MQKLATAFLQIKLPQNTRFGVKSDLKAENSDTMSKIVLYKMPNFVSVEPKIVPFALRTESVDDMTYFIAENFHHVKTNRRARSPFVV